jgi:hypothetical protein
MNMLKSIAFKKRQYFLFLSFLWLVAGPNQAFSQVIVFTAGIPPNPNRYLFQIDLATCQYCPILPTPVVLGQDALVLPNGNVIVCGVGTNYIYTPPNPIPIGTAPSGWESAIIHPNGTIYVSTGSALLTYDPVTNTTTTIGSFPSAYNVDALYTVGNTLYGFGYWVPGTRPVFEINVTNPALTTMIYPGQALVESATTASNGQAIVTWGGGGVTPQMDFGVFSNSTFTWTPICQTPLSSIRSLTALPAGVAIPPCSCLTSSAGTPVTPTTNACIPLPATVNFNANQILDPDDGVNYILYTDLANPLSSILFQNNTGVFPLVPPLVAGVTYYVSRIVGNITGTQVSLGDPCLDVSPATQLQWRSIPQFISMTGAATDLCPGQCQTVTLQVSGTPPFSIGWQMQQGGAVVTPTTFLGNQSSSTITFQACSPGGGVTGPVNLVLCGLLDAYCVNQP